MTYSHFVYCYEDGKNYVLSYHYSESACMQILDIIFRTQSQRGAYIENNSVIISQNGEIVKKWGIGKVGDESSLGIAITSD